MRFVHWLPFGLVLTLVITLWAVGEVGWHSGWKPDRSLPMLFMILAITTPILILLVPRRPREPRSRWRPRVERPEATELVQEPWSLTRLVAAVSVGLVLFLCLFGLLWNDNGIAGGFLTPIAVVLAFLVIRPRRRRVPRPRRRVPITSEDRVK